MIGQRLTSSRVDVNVVLLVVGESANEILLQKIEPDMGMVFGVDRSYVPRYLKPAA